MTGLPLLPVTAALAGRRAAVVMKEGVELTRRQAVAEEVGLTGLPPLRVEATTTTTITGNQAVVGERELTELPPPLPAATTTTTTTTVVGLRDKSVPPQGRGRPVSVHGGL